MSVYLHAAHLLRMTEKTSLRRASLVAHTSHQVTVDVGIDVVGFCQDLSEGCRQGYRNNEVQLVSKQETTKATLP